MDIVLDNNQKQLPNASAVLVLGILSIVTSCFMIGLVLGIVGLIISAEPNRMYRQSPDLWLGYGNLNAGRIMCIIGVIIGGLLILYMISMFLIFGVIAGAAGGLNNFFN